MTEQFETVIVGGAQAGLATGYHLKRRGHTYPPFPIFKASRATSLIDLLSG